MSVNLIYYEDPDRLHMAKIAAKYLSRDDEDNVLRPISLMKKGHNKIFRHVHVRFEYDASLVARDHLLTYTTAPPACAGLRANEAEELVDPVGAEYPAIRAYMQANLDNYQEMLNVGVKPQDARYVAPCGVKVSWIQTWNLQTLIEAFFPQRLWLPGTQGETHNIAQVMYQQLCSIDHILWGTVKDYYGPEAQAWPTVMRRVRKAEPALYSALMDRYGVNKSMWDK